MTEKTNESIPTDWDPPSSFEFENDLLEISYEDEDLNFDSLFSKVHFPNENDSKSQHRNEPIEKIEKNYLNKNIDGTSHSNEFPIEVFPSQMQEIICGPHKCLAFPVDFIASSMLFSASVSIGNTHKVEVTRGWQEPGIIYLALVGRAGTNKSHPLSFALQPIFDADKRTYHQFELQRVQYEESKRILKSENKGERNDDPFKPVWLKRIVSDFTPEALAQVHKNNKRGIAVYADELAGWFKNFNRYHNGADQEFWLSTWNGKPINIDRKSGEPVFITDSFISVIGTIQNRILYEMSKNNRTENGFIDRILFVIPDKLEKPYWNDETINPLLVDKWNTILTNLLSIPFEVDSTLSAKSKILTFSTEAWELLKKWQWHNTDLVNSTENDRLSGIYAKLEIYAIRFALILELLFWACGESNKQAISVRAVLGALKLIEYFRDTAETIQSLISNYSPLDRLTNDLKALYTKLPIEFTTDEGHQIARSSQISTRTFHRLLTNKELFLRVKRGVYEKIA